MFNSNKEDVVHFIFEIKYMCISEMFLINTSFYEDLNHNRCIIHNKQRNVMALSVEYWNSSCFIIIREHNTALNSVCVI